MTWYLSYRGTKKSLAAWHIYDVNRRVLNQGTDTLSFKMEANNIRFDCDETIEIFKDDTRWFLGRIVQIPCQFSATEETKLYHVAGPNWYLEHLIFQQSWHYFNDAKNEKTISIPRSLCLLGQSENGTPMNAKNCLMSLVNYCIQQGAPLQLGKFEGFDFFFPCETVKDCSCMEIIQKLLRWTPDAVCWFDYSTDKPTLNFSRQAFLKPITLSLHQLTQFSLTPRNDLKLNGVVLKYEHSNSNESGTWKTTTIDVFPKNCQNNAINTLVLTIELEGTHTHVQEQWVQIQPIQTDSVDWWKQHFPTLKNIPNNAIKIESVQRTTSLPNELIEGAIAPWMYCKAQYETITAQMSYKTKDVEITQQSFAVKICSTDAVSKTYRKYICLTEGVKPPQNLAQTLYDATQCLHYEGSLQFECEELGTSYLGTKLNFLHGDKAWESLQVPVQEERMHLDSGTVQLKFGAPKHLGPNDLIQLMRANRLRNISNDPNMRFAQKASGQSRTYFPHLTPIINSSCDQGTYAQLLLKSGDKTISIDAASLPPNTQMSLKPFDVVESGVLKKIWLLSS